MTAPDLTPRHGGPARLHPVRDLLQRRYGAGPVHLLAVIAGGTLALIAAGPLLAERSIEVATWFLAGAVLHDLLILPIYVAADRGLARLWRARPGRVAWLNFVRVPLAFSAVLFLVWSPLISRQAEQYPTSTGRSTDPYLGRWLAVSAVLLLLSAGTYLIRLAMPGAGRVRR